MNKIAYLVLAWIIGVMVGLSASSAVCAAERDIRIGLILASDHRQGTGVLNEQNEGLYGSVNGWTLAYFRNSFDTDSVLVAREFGLHRWEKVEAAVTFGVANGYEDNPMFSGDMRLYVALSLRLGPVKYWHSGIVSVIGIEQQLGDF